MLSGDPAFDVSQPRHRESNDRSFDDDTEYLSGAWVTGREISGTPGLLLYIVVDSIDATLAEADVHGGEIIEAPHLDSPGGRMDHDGPRPCV